MRKNNTAIILGGLFFSCSVMAGAGTLAPTVVPMVNGGQASIAISNTSPNLFTVPGDRIIAVNSLDGALTNNEQTASGGVVVSTSHPACGGFTVHGTEAGEWLGGNARAFRQRQCEGFCLRHTDGNGQRHPERSGPQRS